MKCPKCQYENPEDIKFCGECGTKLERICPSCNSSNPPQFKFCGECGYNLSIADKPSPKDLPFDEKIAKIQKYLPKGLTEKILSQKDRIEGERKQVTIMFCDMEGFTALSEKLGAEEAYSMMDQVYEILIHKVHDYEGTVNEMTGDGIMALFGAPIALEDAPQRAIRSSLAIHRELTKFNNRIKQKKEHILPLKMRIGIHSGSIVVGTLGNDLRVEFKAVGDTVNIASRIEGLAQPGVTYITDETYKLTEGFFRVEALGERKIKGKQTPVRIYRVIAPSTLRTRFDVSAERGLTPFIGRDRELELLLDGFERAKAGRGQAFSIVSEAGVGKSRLLYEFRKAVYNEDVTFLEGKCLSYSRGTAYHLHIDILKANFDIRDDDRDFEVREKVKRGLKILSVEEGTTLPYLLETLGIKDSGIDKIPMSPEAKKARIAEAFKRIILKGSEIRPLILSYEDLHWTDNSSEDVLQYVLESIPGARVLMIFTYRPEFVPTWGGRSYQSQVNLNRLSNRESLSMVAHLLGTEDIESALEELILDKTEGVPFYIEEFIMSFKDLQVIERKDGTYRIGKEIQTVSIPAKIQDVIMARVDSLSEEAKDLIRAGSVAGREFNHELIKKVTGLPDRELLSQLSALKEAELLYERGIYPESTYVFKHALTQEGVYQSLLKRTRQKYHQDIAQVLEEHFPGTTETHPELLGHHFTEAGLVEQAISYWQRAGEIAIRRSANIEAVDHLTKGVVLLRNLAETPDRLQQELTLQITMGPALAATKGWAAPEVKHAYSRARELCQQVEDPPQLFTALRGLWHLNHVRAEYQASYKLAKQLLQLAQKQQEPVYLIGAHRALGADLFWRGEFTKSQLHQEHVTALYDPRQHHTLAFLFWTDPRIHCLSYMALISWLLGYPDQALQRSHQTLTLAHEFSHSFSLATAMYFALWLHFFCRDIKSIQEEAKTLIKLSTEQGFPVWVAGGTFLQGWTSAMEGQEKAGIRQISQAIPAYQATGGRQKLPFYHATLAEVYGNAGQIEPGLNALVEAQALVNKTGERWWEAEVYRLKGELLRALPAENQSGAESCFHQALDVARRQHSKSLELRAAMSLSRLWLGKGKKEEAKQLLVEIYGWFTEGFDTPDLKEAKGLLHEIS